MPEILFNLFPGMGATAFSAAGSASAPRSLIEEVGATAPTRWPGAGPDRHRLRGRPGRGHAARTSPSAARPASADRSSGCGRASTRLAGRADRRRRPVGGGGPRAGRRSCTGWSAWPGQQKRRARPPASYDKAGARRRARFQAVPLTPRRGIASRTRSGSREAAAARRCPHPQSVIVEVTPAQARSNSPGRPDGRHCCVGHGPGRATRASRWTVALSRSAQDDAEIGKEVVDQPIDEASPVELGQAPSCRKSRRTAATAPPGAVRNGGRFGTLELGRRGRPFRSTVSSASVRSSELVPPACSSGRRSPPSDRSLGSAG